MVILVLSFFLINFRLCSAYSYYEDSLHKEVTNASFTLLLSEQTYYLIIDNSGFISGEEGNREDASVTVSIDGGKEVMSKTEIVRNGGYEQFQFTIQISGGSSATFNFVINANNPISLFVCNEKGFQEFVQQYNAANRIDIETLLLYGIPAAILLIAVILLINYRKSPSTVNNGDLQLQQLQHQKEYYKNLREQERQRQKEAAKKEAEQRAEKKRCPFCKHPYSEGAIYCSECGKKLDEMDQAIDFLLKSFEEYEKTVH